MDGGAPRPGGGGAAGGGAAGGGAAAQTFRLAEVTVGARIGSGALGEVRRGTIGDVGVALKALHMLRTDAAAQAQWGGALSPAERRHQLEVFRRECDTMRGLVHPNILPFVGVVVDDTPAAEPLYLATQFIESGTLHELVHEPRYAAVRTAAGGLLPMEAQLVVFVGMFAGLEYLAERRLIHRDVKPANILVVVEGGTLTKVLLADFGESKQLTRTMTRIAGTVAGSPAYMAPDMREADEPTGPKADVFSAGIVLIEVASGRQPNPGPEMRRRRAVPEEERRAADLAAVRSPEIVELARRCVVDDQDARADATEMVGRCRALVRVAEAPAVRVTLLVRNVSDGRQLSLRVTAGTPIADVRRRLAEQTGQAVASLQLLFCGRRLDDGRSVG